MKPATSTFSGNTKPLASPGISRPLWVGLSAQPSSGLPSTRPARHSARRGFVLSQIAAIRFTRNGLDPDHRGLLGNPIELPAVLALIALSLMIYVIFSRISCIASALPSALTQEQLRNGARSTGQSRCAGRHG